MHARVLLNYREFAFLLKTRKTSTLQQVTGGNRANVILKRMQGYFLKTPPLEKILKC